jgi:DNA primase
MTIREAKEMDMVSYLSRLGYEPQDKKGCNYWYISPLRDEKTPSFKVNSKMNRWYDWGEGRGGNLIDFGTLYHKCGVKEFLQKLASESFSVLPHQKPSQTISTDDEKSQIKVTSVRPIVSLPLLRYLQKRRIPQAIADQYCKEVNYQLNEKEYYAIGFKNDAGGYELRNEYIKGASSPKDITFVDNGSDDLVTFEGFFNFLSYRAMYDKQDVPLRNFLILNSTSFFEKSLPLMQRHSSVHLYLDNDKTGQKFTQQALDLGKEKFKDERALYQKYSDLNDMLMNIGQTQKSRLTLKP